MNIYEELYKFLNRQIDSIERELLQLDNISNSVEIIKGISEQLTLEKIDINEIKQLASNLNIHEKSKVFELISRIEIIMDVSAQFETNIINVDDTKLSNIFDIFSIVTKDKYQKDLITIKNTYKYINDPSFQDEELIEAILNLKNDIEKTLNKCFNDTLKELKKVIRVLLNNFVSRSGKYNFKRKELNIFLNKLNNVYLKKFNLDGPILVFNSSEEMKEFFELLKDSGLDEETVLKLIMEFSKYNIEYHNKRLSARETVVRTSVEENAKIVAKKIESIARDISNNSENSVEQELEVSVDLFELTEDELSIYNQIKEIVELHSNEIIDADVVELLKDEYSVETRKGFYGTDNSLDWYIIITDIKRVLEPNIRTNKESVFEIFKYILEINQKFAEYNNRNQERRIFLEQLNKTISNVLKENEGILRNFKDLSAKKQNYYISIYQLIKNNDIYAAEECAKQVDKPIEHFEKLGLVLELVDLNIEIETI